MRPRRIWRAGPTAYGKDARIVPEEIYYDKKDQLQIVQNRLLPDETVFAV